jgi:ABC-type polysaccharide/polyol phosphate export permease
MGEAIAERAIAKKATSVLELDTRPESVRAWLADVAGHGEVLWMLARKDFQTRYKRASFGVIWAVVVPFLQAAIMAVVFSRVIKVGSGQRFAVYVMSGVIAFSYFTTVLTIGSTAIVDGASLTDKVWFPRALLVIVPALSNLVGLAVTLLVLIATMPILGVSIHLELLLLLPAALLLIAFATSLSLVLSALHVYFRDVRFLVQASVMVWLYVTPVLYPKALLGGLSGVVDINPMTGVVTLFHMATVGDAHWQRPVLISVAVTLVLIIIGAEVQRRYDRLFVDQL